MYMYATALSHKIILPNKVFLNSAVSYSSSGLDFVEERLDYEMQAHPQSNAQNNTSRFTIQSDFTKRFGDKHSNSTGIRYNNLSFDIDVEQSPAEGEAPVQISDQTGNTDFIQLYSQ